MSPHKQGMIAAAEALLGVVCWSAGTACAMNLTTCNSWERNTVFVVLAVAFETIGLLLFTNARVRHAKRMGMLKGELEGMKKAHEHMREFLTERAVFVVGQMPERPPKPVEKAPN